MADIQVFKQKDLVLKIDQHYNPSVLNLSEWSHYLDILCGDREYQKEAIKNSIVFFASGQYTSISDLAIANYQSNPKLQQKYSSINKFIDNMQIKDRFHANIDLATGTGKSYVIYGVAQIMLALGIVKRVLVLCPSLTIEKGLKEKFLNLASDPDLKAAIPQNAIISNPSIINANQTITEGDLCIENIHAVYEGTGSSIRDSFSNGGDDTLILNDESHHIYNDPKSTDNRSSEGKNIKKWKEFLTTPEYNFRFILGFTGTAYIDNEYFPDVIYRYSLREAIDNKMVKSIEYVQEDYSSNKDYEKFQKIYSNHLENQRKNRKIKPITIMVAKDIENANRLHANLCSFLADWKGIDFSDVSKSVLIVTSHQDHKSNIPILSNVDNKDNPIEWIISVSMLTEGWDVKNVFQIVPWEDRAFNSKLLISQVLGRGLRIPEGYSGIQPSVIVFNHDSWSKNIVNLVNEVLEIEKRLISSVKFQGQRNRYNFSIYNLSYIKKEKEIEHPEDEKNLDYSKSWNEGIKLISQPDGLKRKTYYESLSKGNLINREYNIDYKTIDVDEIVNKILSGFRTREWEGGILGLGDNEVYNKENMPTRDRIRELITNSMTLVGITGESLSEENSQRVMRTFSTLFRKSSKTVVLEKELNEPFEIKTIDMSNSSIAFSSLRRGASVFYATDYNSIGLSEEQVEIFKEFLNDMSFTRNSSFEINEHNFKTPANFVFTSENPEFEFTKQLCDFKNSESINAWIKSRDQGFYQIEYSIRVSNHQKQKTYNPDYFLACTYKNKEYIIVAEIKADRDNSDENKAKYRYAVEHFKQLNQSLEVNLIQQEYIFHFLSPVDYQTFFDYIANGKIFERKFKSELELLLEENKLDL